MNSKGRVTTATSVAGLLVGLSPLSGYPQADLSVDIRAPDTAGSEAVRTPLAAIDPTWRTARAHDPGSGVASVLAERLARAGYAYVHHGDINGDGRRDLAVAGVYRDTAGVAGQFVLIASERSAGRWEPAFVEASPTGGGIGFLRPDSAGVRWWKCIDCSRPLSVRWTRDRYESKWVEPPLHEVGEIPEDVEYLIAYRPAANVLKQLRARCELPADSAAGTRRCAIQDIEDAEDNGAHSDFYSIRITRLPVIGGERLRREALLLHLRGDLNAFVDTSAIRFRPFEAQDGVAWSSDSPRGAILHVERRKDGRTLGDGAFLVAAADDHQLVLTTLRTERHGLSPFSGTRELVLVPFGDDGAILYTAAVLRISWGWYLDIERSLYRSVEAAWSGFSDRVVRFVNENGGRAHHARVHYGQSVWPIDRLR